MSKIIADHFARKRILKANSQIRALQRGLWDQFHGRHVKLLSERRGTHSRRKYKPGDVFKVYELIVDGRDIGVWLARLDSPTKFELAVWLHEVEFLSPKEIVKHVAKT